VTAVAPPFGAAVGGYLDTAVAPPFRAAVGGYLDTATAGLKARRYRSVGPGAARPGIT